MGMYVYTHTDTNIICKVTGFSLAFVSFFLINNNNINSLNDPLLNY